MSELRGEVVMKTGVVIPVSAEVLEDSNGVRTYMARALDDSFDRYLHPWKYPDRPSWPESFVLFPQVLAFAAAVQERRKRARDAWSVLRGHDRIHTYEDDEW